MKSQKDLPDTNAEPGVETDALRLSDIAGRDSADIGERSERDPLGWDEEGPASAAMGGAGRIILGVVVVGVAAAAVVGAKLAYDRRKSARGYRKAVAQIEDARDAIISAAAELPERGREVLHKVRHH
jgi:hypothetical protein